MELTGERLRQARERAELTQEQLAAALNVGARTVGNWERGATMPRNAMARIIDFFGLSDEPEGPTAADLTDAQLLAELANRLRRTAEEGRRGA